MIRASRAIAQRVGEVLLIIVVVLVCASVAAVVARAGIALGQWLGWM